LREFCSPRSTSLAASITGDLLFLLIAHKDTAAVSGTTIANR
jgi:hypothetical protein